MTDHTTTRAEAYAATIAAEVADLAAGILDGHDLDHLDPHERRHEAAHLWLNELALDVEVARNLRTGDVTAVEVCRSVGGPSAWVTFRASGPIEVLAVDDWGRDRATRLVDRDGLADLMVDLVAEVTS